MRRNLSILSLLIAALWLVTGVPLEVAVASAAGGPSAGDTGELRSRLKAVKVQAPACRLVRQGVPVSPGLQPRVEFAVFTPPAVAAARDVLTVRCPRPVWLLPPSPSLTGQVEMQV